MPALLLQVKDRHLFRYVTDCIIRISCYFRVPAGKAGNRKQISRTNMLLLGLDIGTSSVKASVADAATGRCLASAGAPHTEMEIDVPSPGWAEQDPERWWKHACEAILACHAAGTYQTADIRAIGISYQMHGLVLTARNGAVLRPAIIWCDGRAVATGEKAFRDLGSSFCLSHYMNAPGNFTASKLAWVKENEPQLFARVHQAMLPGDFIALRLTGAATTTPSALSEGIFWDFAEERLAQELLDYYGLDAGLLPPVRPVFAQHGGLRPSVARALSLAPGIAVTYKAGDQLNNAFSLQAMHPGEVAATAGTSGVIFGITDRLQADPLSRINYFAHVNHRYDDRRIGVLLCINGAGISNRWIRNLAGGGQSYAALNAAAASVQAAAGGLFMLPFGNGPERMLSNRTIGAQLHGLDLNTHGAAHLVRAGQEGVAFAFRYGLDIMRENGMHPKVIRAGKANMFLSDVFLQAFVNATGVPVALYDTDGSIGAARGAGVALGGEQEPLQPLRTVTPERVEAYDACYGQWKALLEWHSKRSNQ